MTDCCQSHNTGANPPARYRCPANGKLYHSVALRTVLHHVAEPWHKQLRPQAYYFCSDADCDVVYFGEDDSVIAKSELRTRVGAKEKSPERMICYCFGVSEADAAKDDNAYKFVKQQTRQSQCSCETSNPSGHCCLKDF